MRNPANRPLPSNKKKSQPSGRVRDGAAKAGPMGITNRIVAVAGIMTAGCGSVLYGYEEWSIPNLTAPTRIEAPALEVQIQHQFQGYVNEFQSVSNFFGITGGADVNFGVRATLLPGAQLYTSYDSHQYLSGTFGEYTFGSSYAVFFHPLFSAQLDGQIFSYARYDNRRIAKPYLQLSLQNDPVMDRLSFLADIGYNFAIQHYGAGAGVDVKLTEMFDLYGEIFPWVDRSQDTKLGDSASSIKAPFLFGLKITTAGHQFFLFAGNAQENGARHLMRGALDEKLRFGFQLKRLFKL